jgi:Lar family restriction alleviation protein
MESEKLKPCPFCGGDNLRIHRGVSVYYGYCCGCGCQSAWGGSEQAAREKWNTRPADPVKVALAEHLNSCAQWLYAIHEDAPDIWGTRVAKQRADDAEKALQEYRREAANEAQ